jgi:predicted TIM-barrel fold metal-dependent hydrolase
LKGQDRRVSDRRYSVNSKKENVLMDTSRRRFLSALAGAVLTPQVLSAQQATGTSAGTEGSLPKFARIDTHAHVMNHSPQFYAMLKRQNMHLLDINTIARFDRGQEGLEPQQTQALEAVKKSNGWLAWCSTFDSVEWEHPGFADGVIEHLNWTFDQGAIAVKMWKEIGMLIVGQTGKYLMPDDPVFDPILDDLQRRGKTLVCHFADEDDAWEPLDSNGSTYPYFRDWPMWHMYLFPDRPKKAEILAARDRLVARHPHLRIVGCHLASMERDLDGLADRFDRYPNLAVDTAAEMLALLMLPREKVRAFMTKYQDRVLYGTDLGYHPWEQAEEVVKAWESRYSLEWRLFSTDETFNLKDHEVRGLALPESVLRKIYYENAVKWLPGIVG